MLAVDVSNWLRPDAATSPQRSFCHTYPRGQGQAQMIPGWKYSWIAALEPGPTSWTALLDAHRLRPDDDETAGSADRLRAVIERLRDAGHWSQGDPSILIVMDFRLRRDPTDLAPGGSARGLGGTGAIEPGVLRPGRDTTRPYQRS